MTNGSTGGQREDRNGRVRKGIVRYIKGHYNRLIKISSTSSTRLSQRPQTGPKSDDNRNTELAGQPRLVGPEDVRKKHQAFFSVG